MPGTVVLLHLELPGQRWALLHLESQVWAILGQRGRAATATSSVTEFQGFIGLGIIFYLQTCN